MPTNTRDWQGSESHELHPYYGFKSHSTAANHDTEVVMLGIIRSAHPNFHITPVSEKECDFVRWAGAGHATLSLDRRDNHFVSRRKYHAPESRVRGDVGSLGEHITFEENGKKTQTLWKAIKSSYWDDLIPEPATKPSLIDDVQGFFNSRATYREYSAPWKRGIIFHGPPGNGKTMTVKALANSLDQCDDTVAILIVKSFETCQGLQEGIHDVLYNARAMAPCLLVFEDLDSLLVDEVRSYFLNQVDGVDNNDGILIIASTNHVERLDSAVTKRPSRFDSKYHFNLPNERERNLYFEHWKKRLDINNKIDFDPSICANAAKMTEGFSFAYLKELVMQALLALARANLVDANRKKNVDSTSNKTNVPSLVDGQPQSSSTIPGVATTLEQLDHNTDETQIPGSLQTNVFM